MSTRASLFRVLSVGIPLMYNGIARRVLYIVWHATQLRDDSRLRVYWKQSWAARRAYDLCDCT